MTPPKIVAHMPVQNELRWAWFALQSVLDYVDEILVWDLGSSDGTAGVLSAIDSPKIKFLSLPGGGGQNFTATRQAMLAATRADWLLMVDGDEIWPAPAISDTLAAIHHSPDLDYLIQPYYNLVGDIYHYQESKAGHYHLQGLTGHYTIRAINLKHFPGLRFDRPHGQLGVFTSPGVLIQDLQPADYRIMPLAYLHATHLRRSVDATADQSVFKRTAKYKFELGSSFPPDFSYPPSLYLPRPLPVPSPWTHRTPGYLLNAAWQTPLKMIKRRITNPTSGY